ncbi:ABC transporter ATP-binding protein [Amycolatopsis endophytica]|uniref:ABC-type multidrug transport system ATPase subunit n=1 Tax=Amycolatopsis endophytica TaxID=860233 RepID=A0A853B0Q1_9PSEU|nr:ATP-binding cassette domain-containing protein [Amycolatopsis endophytica]NYI88414.1 ABC-type multidrug transport system ATPase subunit [Amycolatopsis endophytica]
MIRLLGVGKNYGGAPVLTGVDLDVRPGSVIGVVGTNGSGKSTLLRIIAGLSRPSSGTVTGRPSVGYVPDRFPASTRMSALAYLRHLARVSGADDVDPRALLERLALAGGPKAALRHLSKGNAQKVGLAQALLAEPDLLVLDEPWSGLDPDAHEVLAEIIAETRDRGASVVFTEHRDERAHAHATDVFRLTDGVLGTVDRSARVVLHGDGPVDLPGVLATHREGDRVELTVAVERTDELLLKALGGGWSVVRVDTPVVRA